MSQETLSARLLDTQTDHNRLERRMGEIMALTILTAKAPGWMLVYYLRGF